MRTHGAAAVLVLLALVAASGAAAHPAGSGQAIRAPAVAGGFYPADARTLRAALEGFFADALPPRVAEPVALVVPHAGYVYSGQIAADAYRQAAGLQIETVVILGTNHTNASFRRVSVYDGAGYRTPLGTAPVDRDLAAALVKEGGGVFDSSLHRGEHSVEVQVPFVQHLFPKASIVPVVVGAPDPDSCRRFGKALASLAGARRLLIVASSDLSHYPAKGIAAGVDRQTLEALANLRTDGFDSSPARAVTLQMPGVSTCACGEGPIRVAMEAARALGALRGTVISYASSGDTIVGDPDRVVGYGAVVFGRGEPGADITALARPPADPRGSLDAADKRVLLRLARESLTRLLETDTLPLPRGGSPKLLREAGAFVTIRKRGELRGCIGRIQPEGPLIGLVARLGLESALKDTRFQPVHRSELKDLEFEVSVLTPPVPVASPGDVVPGRDGVILRVGDRSAVFLPQVATEQGWGREELLDRLAEKAGLRPRAWRGKNASLLTFQADVFSESAFK
ncbi:MAG TPA: AmmeMemoRadiSam system protein B [Vicinamibacterales bacterium]|nr:AmmeMemoRadiSam system protein B [Vicinamibacterales bacterium]HPW21267.1 AmmeMemoRadiSam system protein B [Vicinamibacterales bacterium]